MILICICCICRAKLSMPWVLLILMSCSVDAAQEPRYLKSSTTSGWVQSIALTLTSLALMLIGMTYVFLAFSPTPMFLGLGLSFSTTRSRVHACSTVSERSEISSAKSQSVTIFAATLRLARFGRVNPNSSSRLYITLRSAQCRATIKRNEERVSPSSTPAKTWKVSVSPTAVRTLPQVSE